MYIINVNTPFDTKIAHPAWTDFQKNIKRVTCLDKLEKINDKITKFYLFMHCDCCIIYQNKFAHFSSADDAEISFFVFSNCFF